MMPVGQTLSTKDYILVTRKLSNIQDGNELLDNNKVYQITNVIFNGITRMLMYLIQPVVSNKLDLQEGCEPVAVPVDSVRKLPNYALVHRIRQTWNLKS